MQYRKQVRRAKKLDVKKEIMKGDEVMSGSSLARNRWHLPLLILEITSWEKKGPSGPDPQMNRKRGEGLSLKGEKRGGALFWGGRLAQL